MVNISSESPGMEFSLPHFPSRVLTTKEKNTLFLKAMYTTINYMGCPTQSCKTDYLNLFKFAVSLFVNYCENLDLVAIYQKAKAMSPPEFNIIVGSVDILFSSEFVLSDDDSVLLHIGTNPQNMRCLTAKNVAPLIYWNEEFLYESNFNDSLIVIEVWVQPRKGLERLIGVLTRDFESFASTGNKIYEMIKNVNSSEETFIGCASFVCHYDIEESNYKLNSIIQHIQFCCLCFESRLQTLKNIHYDDLILKPSKVLYEFGQLKNFPTEIVTFLHQHALQNELTPYENLICCFIVTNQYFVINKNIRLIVNYIILREITALGKCPQKPLLPFLKNAMKEEILASVKKCCKLLCFIHSKNSDAREDGMAIILKYLYLIQHYFSNETINFCIRMMQTETYFALRAPLTLTALSSQLSRNDLGFEDFRKLQLQNLKDIDQIFLEEWKFTYTSFMFKLLDEEMTQFLSSLIRIAMNNFENRTISEIYSFIELYYFLSEFISHFEKIGSSQSVCQQFGIHDFHQMLEDKIFHFYMNAFQDENVVSWLNNYNIEDTDAPLSNYCEKIANEWMFFVINNPKSNLEPPLAALIEVFCTKMINFSCILRNNFRQKFTIPSDNYLILANFVQTNARCRALSKKMDVLVKWTTMMFYKIFTETQPSLHPNFVKRFDELLSNLWIYPGSHDNAVAKIKAHIKAETSVNKANKRKVVKKSWFPWFYRIYNEIPLTW